MLIMLSVFLMPICIGASWDAIEKRVQEYMAAFLVMEVLMIGIFAAQDLFLFYIFFEAGLIPMYLIIGIWGGANRIYASYKFFLYTLLGSVLMLIAMLWMAQYAGTTSIPMLMNYDFPAHAQTWLWLAFFASFAVKMPMWPVHTWLARRARPGADRGLGDPGGRAAEAGRLWFHPLLAADVPGGLGPADLADLRPVGGGGGLHLAGRAGAERHEEADRLFLGRAHGDRDDRPVRLQPPGHRGRDDRDAQPRPGLGRAVPVRRRDLRPAPYPRDRAAMAAWRSTCRAMRCCSCSSPWPRSACPGPAASSASSCR